jgi:tRNA1(Val) A37 N6-methylase TrmN6
MEVIAGRIETAAVRRDFHHAIANPPYHEPAGTPSPVATREAAKRGSNALLQAWTGELAGHLRDRGTLTLVVPAGTVPACLAAMTEARCPCSVIFPLWPMAGRAAKLVMIRGIKNSRAPMRLAPGLVLHQQDGAFTEAAQAILRDGAALVLG